MTTEDNGDAIAARDIKKGDRLLIRRPGHDDVTVVVDDEPAEDERGSVTFTTRPV